MQIQSLRIHPLANAFPMLEGDDFLRLKEDIRANGQSEPILVLRDEVIDGRNRLKACEELGIAPITHVLYQDWTEEQIKAKIFSLNIHRRHLTPIQVAAYLVFQGEILRGGDHKSQDYKNQTANFPFDRDTVAEVAGVSTRLVTDLNRLKRHAPATLEKVMTGEIDSINSANIDAGFSLKDRMQELAQAQHAKHEAWWSTLSHAEQEKYLADQKDSIREKKYKSAVDENLYKIGKQKIAEIRHSTEYFKQKCPKCDHEFEVTFSRARWEEIQSLFLSLVRKNLEGWEQWKSSTVTHGDAQLK